MRSIIYLRTSTEEQTPENQLKDCIKFVRSRGFEIDEERDVFIEKVSAWKKSTKRPLYEEIKQLAHEGKINTVIVWALDRWIRDRDTLLEDIAYLTSRNVKLYSVKESYLEAINIEGPMGKTIREFLLGLLGSIAEIESTRRSERVKIAHQNHKGKKWGRKPLPKQTRDRIIKLHQEGLSIRKIQELVKTTDKNYNQKNISLGSVHKTIADFISKKDSN